MKTRRSTGVVVLEKFTRNTTPKHIKQKPNPTAEVGVLKPRRVYAVTVDGVMCCELFCGNQRSGRRYKWLIYMRESAAQRRADAMNACWNTTRFGVMRLM
jgi:hypothetical protein